MNIIWAISRYILPIITVVILIKCILTLMLGHPKEKIYGYIIDMKSGNRHALNMWETSVGRSKSCDIVLSYDTVSRSHAVISRRIDGWYLHDLLTKAELKVNGTKVEQKALIKDGDMISFGGHRFRFEVADDPVQTVGKNKKQAKGATAQRPAPNRQNAPSTRQKPPSGGSYTDERLRKRNTSASSSASSSGRTAANSNAHYSDTNRPNLNFQKRPATTTPPAATERRDIYSVETPARPAQPKPKKRKQPRISNKDTGEVFILCGNEVTIGSGRKCDIRLNGADVERHHSTLVLYGDGWAIEQGTGKAYLNSVEVKSPQLLFDGDIIAMGDERLYFSL